MKKLLLISLVIFFVICSRSWALPECEGSPQTEGSINWNNCIGTYNFANGAQYVGEFKDGKYNVQGTYIHADGAKYVGEFKDNKRHGQGTDTYANGDKYVGEFKDDKYNGFGTFTFSTGISIKYEGFFKDGKRHGQATENYKNGDKFIGKFSFGSKEGWGTYYKNNGDKFHGIYKYSVRNGKGELTYKDGRVIRGVWKNDKLLLSSDTYSNGTQSDAYISKKNEAELIIKKEKQTFENAKLECEAIGYKKGTEKFGECVLDLTE